MFLDNVQYFGTHGGFHALMARITYGVYVASDTNITLCPTCVISVPRLHIYLDPLTRVRTYLTPQVVAMMTPELKVAVSLRCHVMSCDVWG